MYGRPVIYIYVGFVVGAMAFVTEAWGRVDMDDTFMWLALSLMHFIGSAYIYEWIRVVVFQRPEELERNLKFECAVVFIIFFIPVFLYCAQTEPIPNATPPIEAGVILGTVVGLGAMLSVPFAEFLDRVFDVFSVWRDR